MTAVKFKTWNTVTKFACYENGRPAILLVDANDESPIATASVNLPDINLAEGLIAIKDYAENEGMLNALMDAGIVSPPVAYIPTGFVTVPVCRLLETTP